MGPRGCFLGSASIRHPRREAWTSPCQATPGSVGEIPGGKGTRILLSHPVPAAGNVTGISSDLPMNWFYAFNGQPTGPVTEDQLAELLRNGSINGATLVWRQGMPNWLTLAEAIPGLVTPALPSAETPALPSQSGPPLVPAMAAPVPHAAPTPAPDSWISEEELLAGDYSVDFGATLGKGWETFFKNPLLLLGGAVLIWLLIVASSLVPCVGSIVTLVVTGPLLGGLWTLYLRQIRTGAPDLGLIFSAFGPRFMQYFLVHLVPALINVVVMLPLLAGIFFTAFGMAAAGGHRGGPPDFQAIWAAIGVGALIIWGLIAFLTVVASTALMLLWLFAMPLVADKGYDFWPAMQLSRKMVMKHFWWTVLFMLVLWLVSMLGVLALCIGLLVSGPVVFATLCHWYESVFGRLRPKSVVP